MTATASPTPASWVLPPGATGATATTTTDATGSPTSSGPRRRRPTSRRRHRRGRRRPGFENVPSATACTYRTPDQDDTTAARSPQRDGGFSATVPDDAIVTCRMVNRVPPAPAVTIEKSTNGADADSPPGPVRPGRRPGRTGPTSSPTPATSRCRQSPSPTTSGRRGHLPGEHARARRRMTCTATGAAPCRPVHEHRHRHARRLVRDARQRHRPVPLHRRDRGDRHREGDQRRRRRRPARAVRPGRQPGHLDLHGHEHGHGADHRRRPDRRPGRDAGLPGRRRRRDSLLGRARRGPTRPPIRPPRPASTRTTRP